MDWKLISKLIHSRFTNFFKLFCFFFFEIWLKLLTISSSIEKKIFLNYCFDGRWIYLGEKMSTQNYIFIEIFYKRNELIKHTSSLPTWTFESLCLIFNWFQGQLHARLTTLEFKLAYSNPKASKQSWMISQNWLP